MSEAKLVQRPAGGRSGQYALESSGRVFCHVPQAGRPPLFVERRDDALESLDHFLDWARAHLGDLDACIVEHGGIVLRGFPVWTAEEFDALASIFPAYSAGYVGGWSPRVPVAGRVMESTRLAEDLKLSIHSEMFYLRDYPARIAFFCKTPALEGGETIIGDLRAVSRKLPKELAEKIESAGIRTVRNYAAPTETVDAVFDDPDDLPWTVGFGTEDRAEVERRCAAIDLQTIWNEDGSLTVVNRVEAFSVHPQTGQRIYRSSMHSIAGTRMFNPQPGERKVLPTGITLGDGSILSERERAAINALIDEETIAWPWQAGDVMILDNLQVGHGRNPYKGPREVLVALLD